MIERLGGSIRFESEHNQGSTFYLKFPVKIGNKADLKGNQLVSEKSIESTLIEKLDRLRMRARENKRKSLTDRADNNQNLKQRQNLPFGNAKKGQASPQKSDNSASKIPTSCKISSKDLISFNYQVAGGNNNANSPYTSGLLYREKISGTSRISGTSSPSGTSLHAQNIPPVQLGNQNQSRKHRPSGPINILNANQSNKIESQKQMTTLILPFKKNPQQADYTSERRHSLNQCETQNNEWSNFLQPEEEEKNSRVIKSEDYDSSNFVIPRSGKQNNFSAFKRGPHFKYSEDTNSEMSKFRN